MSLSKAFEMCNSEESCVAVQANNCQDTKAQICDVPTTGQNTGVPFRDITGNSKYCLYEKGNVKYIIYKPHTIHKH